MKRNPRDELARVLANGSSHFKAFNTYLCWL